MNFISEEVINQVLDELSEDDTTIEYLTKEFAEAQPFLLSFLLSEGFEVLDAQEKSLLFYLAMVMYFSVVKVYPEIDIVELVAIQAIDEENWTTVDQSRFKTMKEIADHFFNGFKQEDLLAFVEDALMEDEEYSLSNIGRNVIFVSMKSIIDALDQNIEAS